MLRARLFTVALSTLLLVCGCGSSSGTKAAGKDAGGIGDSARGEGGVHPTPDATCSEANASDYCCGPADCPSKLGQATCTSTGWACPQGGMLSSPCSDICAETLPDAGQGCGAGQEVCCESVDGCLSQVAVATCSDGTWTCPAGGSPSPGCPKGCGTPVPDSGFHPVDAGPTFSCGTLGMKCSVESEFCSLIENPGADGGTTTFAECEPTPTTCALPTTCACAEGGLSDAKVLGCTDTNGEVTVTVTPT